MDGTAIANRYIALWNETDPTRRAALLAETFTPNATYSDPITSGTGHAEIGALIAGVQARFPGYRFALIGTPEQVKEHLRFSWSLGPANDPATIKGTDFAQLDGDRFAHMTGFLDQVPAAA